MNLPEQIKRIERAKMWAGVLAFIFAATLIRDGLHAWKRSQGMESWYFGAGQFRVNGEVIDNKDRTSDTGIWITGESSSLQKRGEPRWIFHTLGLVAVIQIFRNLKKAYEVPAPKRHEDGTMTPPPASRNERWEEAAGEPGAGGKV